MKQKRTRRGICWGLTLLICLQTVFSFGIGGNAPAAYAASKKVTVKFASSVRKNVKAAAKKAGADTSKIAVAKVVNYTNIFSEPGEKGTLLGRLYKGSGAYIIKTSGDFSYISSGSLTGWAKNKCLITGTEAKTFYKTLSPKVATVKTEAVNVRSSASTGSRLLGELKKGTKVLAVSSTDSWVKVRLTNADYGYVFKDYVTLKSGLIYGVTIDQEKEMKRILTGGGTEAEDSNGKEETVKEENVKKDSGAASDEFEDFNDTTEAPGGNWVSLGTFKLTAYCPCAKCNGAGNAGKTATGAPPVVGHTIAVDRKVIPLGSKIKIAGSDNVYVAEDTGVSGNTIDVLMAEHSQCSVFGVRYREVYILKD